MIKDLIKQESERQRATINLIASENYVSDAVKDALASDFTNKYSEGYPDKRYYAGNAVVDQLENQVKKLAQEVFQTDYAVNVQAYSGSIANLAIFYALLEPGDKFMGLELSHGGHLTHGHKVTISGKLFNRVTYHVDPKTFLLDYDEIERLAKEHKPKLIISGASAYSREIDFQRISDIAHQVGAYHLADISHISGLIAAGLHPTPFGPSTSSTSLTTSPLGTDNADVVMTTTHKILRGPRGALIFSRKSEYRNPTVQHRSGRLEQSRLSTSLKTTMSPSNGREAKSELISKSNRQLPELIDRAIFPGIQGGPHMNTIAAIGVCLEEALQEHYRLYVIMVQQNAKKLADELIKNGLEIITGGTDNHLFLVDLRPLKLTGQEAQDRLEKAGITVNKNAIPYDQASPMNPSGIRIGTPAITTQGMKPTNMPKLAQQIADRLKS